jgi:O-methyltransferase
MTFPDLAALKEFAGWKAARAPQAAGPSRDPDGLRSAYLGLLKLALCDLVGPTTASVSQMIDGRIASRELRGEDRGLRAAGLDWPLHGLTMVGLGRLDDLEACVETVVRDGVEGDLIEAGAWRGGASILMRATLDALGETERTVFVADSFQGFPASVALDERAAGFFAVDPEEVRESFARLGLEHGVRIVAGYFEETLAALADQRWAVVRLDADTYDATRAALDALYPRLAVGGYLIVDDYGVMAEHECRRAVEEFRAAHGISEPIEEVDWTCVRWRRESDAPIARAGRPTGDRPRPRAAARASSADVPTGRELELEREVEALRGRRRWRDRGR